MTTVYLDLDGTLTDSSRGITRTMQYALEAMGADVPDAESLLWCIGPPLRGNFAKLLGPDADVEEAVRHYRTRYAEAGWCESEAYDGVEEVLESFASASVAMHLVTSKDRSEALRIVEHFGFSKYLGHVFGASADGTMSDKTDLLNWALADTGARPERAVMVGDRQYDMRGATNTGVAGIGALWGFGDADELTTAGAKKLATHPTEIPALVETLLNS